MSEREAEELGSEVEAREPLSRPVSPKRDPRAARTVVSFDWEPFERDVVQVRGEDGVEEMESVDELEIEDPVLGYDPPHRSLETLAEVLKKNRMGD